jgi:hypothetical protein
MCIHIEATTLADGTYELVPEYENEQQEAQVNLTELTEDPDQVRKSPRLIFA